MACRRERLGALVRPCRRRRITGIFAANGIFLVFDGTFIESMESSLSSMEHSLSKHKQTQSRPQLGALSLETNRRMVTPTLTPA